MKMTVLPIAGLSLSATPQSLSCAASTAAAPACYEFGGIETKQMAGMK